MPNSRNASGSRIRWFLPVPVLGIATVIASACGGSGDKGPTQPAQSDTTLTASLDGTSFTAATATITSAAGRLLIITSNGPNESMGLGFDLVRRREGR